MAILLTDLIFASPAKRDELPTVLEWLVLIWVSVQKKFSPQRTVEIELLNSCILWAACFLQSHFQAINNIPILPVSLSITIDTMLSFDVQ